MNERSPWVRMSECAGYLNLDTGEERPVRAHGNPSVDELVQRLYNKAAAYDVIFPRLGRITEKLGLGGVVTLENLFDIIEAEL